MSLDTARTSACATRMQERVRHIVQNYRDTLT